MERVKKNWDVLLGALLLVIFMVFTILVKNVGLLAVGPLGSEVGFGKINDAVHDFIGVNMTLYTITDYLGLVAFAIMITFAIVGIIQWIKRKSLLKVDGEILALGIFYVLLASAYVFFEFVVINCRPVLIEGVLEASYPSSTTMLALSVCLSSLVPTNKLIKNKKVSLAIKIALIAFAVFMVVGRLISGVHWFTDIVAGVILSFSLLFIYRFFVRMVNKIIITNQQN